MESEKKKKIYKLSKKYDFRPSFHDTTFDLINKKRDIKITFYKIDMKCSVFSLKLDEPIVISFIESHLINEIYKIWMEDYDNFIR